MAAKKRTKKVSKRTTAPVARKAKSKAKRTAKAARAAPSEAAVKRKKAPARKKAKASARGATPQPAAAERPTSKASPPRKGKATAAAKAAPASVAPLADGASAPSFELLDQSGSSVSSSSLAGKPYVLYFYPKDDTPGCTTQACGFRDEFAGFERVGARVIGVSPDSVASHERFAGKYGLPFTLLSDPEQVLATAYGVWALKKNYGREYLGIVRSTFLVDADGVVRKSWRGVRVNGHVLEVQGAAAQLAS